MAEIVTHDEKVAAIRKFLDSDDEDGGPSFQVLLVVGDGATGKSSALEEALAATTPAAAADDVWNVLVWNCREVPKYCRFSHVGAPTKWVVVRREYDALTRSLVDEWSNDAIVRVMSFLQDPSDAHAVVGQA